MDVASGEFRFDLQYILFLLGRRGISLRSKPWIQERSRIERFFAVIMQ
jgi:hypothetical protein